STRFSASNHFPSVAKMNLAFWLAVAGLSRSPARAAGTLPSGQTWMWMLPRWSTPPGRSDLFVLPLRSRLSVVSLLPNASRKAYGNVAGSNAASANAETAASISTAFIAELIRLHGPKGLRHPRPRNPHRDWV